MPRNDRSDSLSVRSPDDPRRSMRALQNESERELAQEETHETGGPAHRSPAERDRETRGAGSPRDASRERSAEEEEYARAVRRATDEQDRDPPVAPGGDAPP